MAGRCGFCRSDRSTRAMVESKTEPRFPSSWRSRLGMMPGMRGHTRSNRPFKRGFGNCWSLLVRGGGWDLADQQPGFDSESGPNTTGTVRVDSFSTRIMGRIVVISDIYGALEKLTGTSIGTDRRLIRDGGVRLKRDMPDQDRYRFAEVRRWDPWRFFRPVAFSLAPAPDPSKKISVSFDAIEGGFHLVQDSPAAAG